jgi:predicted exporter
MNMPIHAQAFADAQPVAQPLRRNRGEHVFDLHPALHGAVFGGFFAYLGLMWAAFGEKQLAIPFAIFAVFLAAAFIVPGWWARIVPEQGGPKPNWAEFRNEGLVCETGRQSAGGAMVQVLIMPAVLIGWGLFLLVVSRLV